MTPLFQRKWWPLRFTRNMKSTAHFNLVYKALILPHVVYCVCVWAPYQHNHIDRLERIDRKDTQVSFYLKISQLFEKWNQLYTERLVDCNLMKLEDAFDFQRLVFGFKLLHGFLPDSFSSLIRISSLNTFRLLHLPGLPLTLILCLLLFQDYGMAFLLTLGNSIILLL